MTSRRLAALFVGPQGLRAGWGLLLFALTLVVLTVVLMLFVPHAVFGHRDVSDEVALFLAEVLMLVGVCGSTALMARVEHQGVLSYGLRDRRALSRGVSGAVWGVALLTLLVAALFASGHIGIAPGDLTGAAAVNYGLLYAVGFMVVALSEELLFRGYLQVTLARLVGFWPSACLLSLTFGAIHQGNPGESPLGIVAAVLLGLVLCLCLRLSGSLWWGIGFHAAWDWAQSFLWGTPVSGFVLEGRWLHSDARGDPLWSGGAAGPEGSLLVLPILGLTALVIGRSFRRGGDAAPA
jgi:membrane protease YdiL (CAAX protease family)